MRGFQFGRQRLAHTLDAFGGQCVMQAAGGVQAALTMPVGDQQGELAAQQGEDARIAARADDGGCLVEMCHPLHFHLVGDKGLAVQARAFHDRGTSLQNLLRGAPGHVRR
ncbi:hypothetical protein D3C75_822820 [compost metagenome]